MGRARINSHLGEGLYDVTYWRDVGQAAKRLDEIQREMNEITLKLYQPGGALDKKTAAAAQAEAVFLYFESTLQAWAACAITKCPQLSQLANNLYSALEDKADATAAYLAAAAEVSILRARELSLIAEISRLQSTATDKEYSRTEMWCVDYPFEANEANALQPNALVGTAEIYGTRQSGIGNSNLTLPSPGINILPSYQNEAAYNISRDFVQRPIGSMSVSEGIMNVLQFLYVATNKPKYLYGTLTAKDEQTDIGSVSIPGISPIFNTFTLTGVPIVYQTCHSKVFDVGDAVVVKFGSEDFGNPTVIGFASNPKICKFLTLTYSSQAGGSITGTTPQTVVYGNDGTPVTVVLNNPNDPDIAFKGWSDGFQALGMTRQDTNVTQNINAVAIIGTSEWPEFFDVDIDCEAFVWQASFPAGPGSTWVPYYTVFTYWNNWIVTQPDPNNPLPGTSRVNIWGTRLILKNIYSWGTGAHYAYFPSGTITSPYPLVYTPSGVVADMQYTSFRQKYNNIWSVSPLTAPYGQYPEDWWRYPGSVETFTATNVLVIGVMGSYEYPHAVVNHTATIGRNIYDSSTDSYPLYCAGGNGTYVPMNDEEMWPFLQAQLPAEITLVSQESSTISAFRQYKNPSYTRYYSGVPNALGQLVIRYYR